MTHTHVAPIAAVPRFQSPLPEPVSRASFQSPFPEIECLGEVMPDLLTILGAVGAMQFRQTGRVAQKVDCRLTSAWHKRPRE